MFRVMKTGKRMKKSWKRMITKATFVGEGFTRKPPKYERFIRPTGLRFSKAHVTHPDLKTTFQLDIIGVKKNPNGQMYTTLGVLTKGTIIEARRPARSRVCHLRGGPPPSQHRVRRPDAAARVRSHAPCRPCPLPVAGERERAGPRDAGGQGGVGEVRPGDEQPGERRLHQRRAPRVIMLAPRPWPAEAESAAVWRRQALWVSATAALPWVAAVRAFLVRIPLYSFRRCTSFRLYFIFKVDLNRRRS